MSSEDRKYQQRTTAHIVKSYLLESTRVIRKFLTSNEDEEQEWRRTKIFRTWVTVKEKLANLVIDNRSAISFVARKVIDKLPWPTKMLLKPYKVTWANDSVIFVTNKCLVSFKNGSYEDRIWCAVMILMNITHILLDYHDYLIEKSTMTQTRIHISFSGKDDGLHSFHCNRRLHLCLHHRLILNSQRVSKKEETKDMDLQTVKGEIKNDIEQQDQGRMSLQIQMKQHVVFLRWMILLQN